MKINYSLKIVMLFLAMCVSPHVLIKAQSASNYAFSTNANSSLVDMSTGTTQIIASGLDASNSGVVSIGFTFPFMGNAFTQFSVNEDGVMQLGGTSIGNNIYTIAGGTAALPRLAAFNADLRTGVTTGKVHYKIVGTAPNRQLVVEFFDMQLFYTGTGTAGTTRFQIILSETTGQIDYIYGTVNVSSIAANTANERSPSIGFYTGSATNLFASVAYATHTASVVSPYTTNAAVGAVGDITNLTSTIDGSRRVYTFTPTPPASATGLNFTSVAATTMTLNWTDNATTELGYRVYRSLDNITYTLAAQLPANTVTYAATSLNTSTLYYWKVLPYAEIEGASLNGSQSTSAASLAAGIYTVGAGGTYNNLTIAFADINAQALTGNIELQLITGYPATPETYPILTCNATATTTFSVKVYPTVSGLSITSANAAGTLNLNGATNLTFDGRINQAGAKDLIISNTNVGASYAVQYLNDAKSNTLQYLTIHSANNSSTSGTIVFAGSTGTTGNDNNTIDNCDIMDGASTPLNAIYSAGTSTTVDNSGNLVSNSNIFNYFGAGANSNGILLANNSSSWTINANKFYQTATRTITAGSQHRAINVITASGNGYLITNNVIGYASSAATGLTTYTSSAGRFFGIELTASNTGTASSVQGNTISGISLTTTSGTTAAPGIFAGISVLGGTVSVGTTTPNIIGASSGTGAISINTSNTANAFGIHANSTGTLNIVNNVIGAINATGSAAASTCGIVGINTTGATTATTITGNTIGGATVNSIASGTSAFTTTAGTVSGIATANNATLLTISGNTLNNISNYSSSTTAVLNGIVSLNAPVTSIITNNTVSNTLLAAGTLTNISSANPGTLTVSANNIFSSSTTNASATINGISINNGTTSSFFKNKIYNLTASGTGSAVNGILASGGTTVAIYNNVIGDLKTPTTSAADAIRGISITSTTTTSNYLVYYNSVYLNASSTGTNFGTSGIYHTTSATVTTAALDIRNNIVINESTPAGTGISVAYRRSSTALGNYSSISNRNMFYAGIPSATRLIMYDGTTSYQTMTAFQTAVLPREVNTFTGEASFIAPGYGTSGNFFISTTPSNVNYLKPVVGIATQVESGGVNITTPLITDDFIALIRQGNAGYVGTGTSPDLGAFEFEGVNPTPIITLNSVTPATTSQCSATARLVSVNITSAAGPIIGATIGYAVNGVPQANIMMTNISGSTWEGTIPVPTPANATITWGVAAVNSIGTNGSYTGTSYSDEPLFGATASAITTFSTLCAGSPASISAKVLKNGNVTIGTSTSLTTDTEQPTAFCNRWSSYKMQTIYTAAELTAAGLSAGLINSITYNINTLGDATTNTAYTVKIGTTALTQLSAFQANGSYTTVFPSATYTHAIGLNTITFSTPYNWDGISNIIIDVAHNGANATNNSQTYYTTTALNTVAYNYTVGDVFGNKRLNLIFNGIASFPLSSVSWSDGATTVGATNPLTVNPTTTTTYTTTITAAGCTVTPSPSVVVNVNPLPTVPTGTNSAQCGVQTPTASVTSTSGLPTPTFKWYDAATGGTVMQNSASTTYTTAVASTTTFHVAEINTTTGCESPRVAVTVNVSTPDAISATPSATTICLGESVTLVAANTNPTPFQSYTYSWLSTTSSGVETTTVGASIIATPTQAGTYTYNLSGIDGGCSAVTSTIVTVNLNPTSLVASATNPTICNGDATDLAVTGTMNSSYLPATVLAQNFNAGLGTWTTVNTGTVPATNWVVQNAPYSYTSYFNNFATLQGGGFAMTNADAGGSGSKTRTKLVSPSFSTANMTSATLTFENLYRYISNDSLVRLEISTDGGTAWATLKDYLALGVSQGVVTNNAEVPANESIALSAAYLNQANLKIRFNFVSSWGYYWIIDNVIVSGIQEGTNTYAWTSTPAGFNSSVQNPTGATPTVSTNYMVTATNSFGCSATATATVIVNQPSTSSTSITACDSYTWNGTTYNTSGAYTWTGTNAVGCDSVATLNLTIKNSSTSSTSITACNSYTWNGTTYNTSGTYLFTTLNAVSCDSIATLVLTINNSSTSSTTINACVNYTWNSTTYNSSGTYTFTTTNSVGCDSLATLVLTIGQPSTSSTSVTECDSYTWNGTTYNASGTYTYTTLNAVGCDSTATLILTINNSTTFTETATECESYTWNGTTYNASGTYTYTTLNAVGCDSTVTLVLTINNSTTSSTTASACDSYTWNGTTYTASGTYTYAALNTLGCDSTATLVLTINEASAVVTNNSGVFSSNVATSYKWINCATNAVIAGETSQTFTPIVNGSYAVIITNANGCIDTSACVTINNVGIKELVDNSLNVYPNPTNGNVIIEFSAATATVEVVDAQGKLMFTQSVISGDVISLENYDRGVYFLKINSENGSSLQRVVKN